MSKKITAIIVDDESLARRGLGLRLKEYEDIEVIAQCSNGREATAAIAKELPQLVFLDIQMPGMDGFDVVRSIQGDEMPMVIFVTAYDQYAVDAFNVHAVDYLLKPIEEDRLQTAIEKVRTRINEQGALTDKERLLNLIGDITGTKPSNLNDVEDSLSANNKTSYPEKISIKDNQTVTIIQTQDIDWVDAAGDYMCIHVGDDIHIMRTTMKQLEAQLDPDIFQRVHRSTIVNLNRVKQVCSHMNGEYHLILEGGARLKMSRSFKDKVKHFL
ncbi:Transcriptional regulatory protein YehT [Thalassocella blandensis]|nr:Transcriptional regulatory protein YehT [Thalassocella blandensis]